jgi:hypothetical protein
MTAIRLFQTLSDPFGFTEALRGLHLAPEDLPGLEREGRLVPAEPDRQA